LLFLQRCCRPHYFCIASHFPETQNAQIPYFASLLSCAAFCCVVLNCSSAVPLRASTWPVYCLDRYCLMDFCVQIPYTASYQFHLCKYLTL
jgi:hypothetical protein